ncbi:hypothetical protein V8E36_000058 [Tilletia maclaganii]
MTVLVAPSSSSSRTVLLAVLIALLAFSSIATAKPVHHFALHPRVDLKTPGSVCSANAECRSGVCESGRCGKYVVGVPCTSDAYCQTNRCDSLHFNYDFRCRTLPGGEACTQDSFCNSGFCDKPDGASTGTCRRIGPGGTCEIDSDCTSARCDYNTRKCTKTAGSTCSDNQQWGICAYGLADGQTCYGDNECSGTSTCLTLGYYFDIYQIGRCGSAQTATPTPYTCSNQLASPGSFCFVGYDCISYRCSASKCLQSDINMPCFTDDGCSKGVCSPATKRCAYQQRGQLCLSSSQCSTGFCNLSTGQCTNNSPLDGYCLDSSDCRQGVCRSSRCSLLYLSETCTASDQCASNYCQYGPPDAGSSALQICSPAPPGTTCSESINCGSRSCTNNENPYQTGVCRVSGGGGSCSTTLDCQGFTSCVSGKCLARGSATCSANSDCEFGTCASGTCTGAAAEAGCTVPSDCASNQCGPTTKTVCGAGGLGPCNTFTTCNPVSALGGVCSTDPDCEAAEASVPKPARPRRAPAQPDNSASAPPALPRTSPATTSNDCQSGECTDSVCKLLSLNKPCSDSAECSSGYFQSLTLDAQKVCAPAPPNTFCTLPSECGSSKCSNNADTTKPGTCLASTAGQACTSLVDCDGFTTCSEGKCLARAQASCTQNSDCQSGSCQSNVCTGSAAGSGCQAPGDCASNQCGPGTASFCGANSQGLCHTYSVCNAEAALGGVCSTDADCTAAGGVCPRFDSAATGVCTIPRPWPNSYKCEVSADCQSGYCEAALLEDGVTRAGTGVCVEKRGLGESNEYLYNIDIHQQFDNPDHDNAYYHANVNAEHYHPYELHDIDHFDHILHSNVDDLNDDKPNSEHDPALDDDQSHHYDDEADLDNVIESHEHGKYQLTRALVGTCDSNKANGIACYQNAGCTSGYCDPRSKVCSLLPLNAGCTNNNQCQSSYCPQRLRLDRTRGNGTCDTKKGRLS